MVTAPPARLLAVRAPLHSVAPQPALFVHTGWRSGGTWVWSRLRENGRARCFYEPLHEQAAHFRPRDIAALRPQSWVSHHSETEPYFAEYAGLIAKTRRGVPLYQPRFAFDNFFLDDTDHDPELQAYIESLLACAGDANLPAVLKFCRSLGRVAWFERHFPQAAHAVVLRDPLAQFVSTRRLLEQQRNRYFTIAPILVMARNAQHPLVRAAVDSLDIRLPGLRSDNLAYGLETTWRHIRRQDVATRYRGFVAFWTICAVAALQGRALLVDSGGMAAATDHRKNVEDAFAGVLGHAVDLAAKPGQPVPVPPARELLPPDAAQTHLQAASLARSFRSQLENSRLDVILRKLGQETECVPATGIVRLAAGWRAPHPVHTKRHGDFTTACQVLAARAMQSLRRAHGASVQWGARSSFLKKRSKKLFRL